MKDIKIYKGFVIGLIAGLSLISFGTYAATTGAGTIGSLFEKIGPKYYLIGDNIKYNTIDSSEIEDGSIKAIDIDNTENFTFNGLTISTLEDCPHRLITDTNGVLTCGPEITASNLWSENGSDIYYDSGNVGIGTASPSAELEINGRISQIGLGSSTFLGFDAGLSDDKISNRNVGLGYRSLKNNTIGENNIAIGHSSLINNIAGNNNVAVGLQSLYNNTGGINNVANGSYSLRNNESGRNNIAIGHASLLKHKSGRENIAIGSYSLLNNESGNGNVAIGNRAGLYETGSNKLYIDNSPTTNPLIYGNFASNKLKINGELDITGKARGITPDPSDPANTIATKEYVDNFTTESSSLWSEAYNGPAPIIYYNSGSVGIGTDNPTVKLEVVGNIKSTGKIYSDQTVETDPANTLVTKEYVDNLVASIGGGNQGGSIIQRFNVGIGLLVQDGDFVSWLDDTDITPSTILRSYCRIRWVGGSYEYVCDGYRTRDDKGWYIRRSNNDKFYDTTDKLCSYMMENGVAFRHGSYFRGSDYGSDNNNDAFYYDPDTNDWIEESHGDNGSIDITQLTCVGSGILPRAYEYVR